MRNPSAMLGLGEPAVMLDEANDIAQPKPTLPSVRAVMRQPVAVRIAPNSGRADAKQTGRLLERELRIQQPFDEILSRLFKFAGVVVGRHRVVVKVAKEF